MAVRALDLKRSAIEHIDVICRENGCLMFFFCLTEPSSIYLPEHKKWQSQLAATPVAPVALLSKSRTLLMIFSYLFIHV